MEPGAEGGDQRDGMVGIILSGVGPWTGTMALFLALRRVTFSFPTLLNPLVFLAFYPVNFLSFM